MKHSLSSLIFAIAFCSSLFADVSVIPLPSEVTELEGKFALTKDTAIVCASSDADVSTSASLLAKRVASSTGFELKQAGTEKSGKNAITLSLGGDTSLGEEGYTLNVTADGVTITAAKPAGVFYGTQTLLQLFPPEIMSDSKADHIKEWAAPCVTIKDAPRFAWRGMMLDASNHFQSLDYVKKFIDRMAFHKLNVFHWHLVDSHGWRIEIKKYPNLTNIGAWREQPPVGRYGGFYTQDEIKEIVKYAAERHITVVPEIEMPGHSKAAIAAYPELACSPITNGVVDFFHDFPPPNRAFPTSAGVNEVCPGKEFTFEFLQDVLKETLALFPSKYIHVGGDEADMRGWEKCPSCKKRMEDNKLKNCHELQSYLMKRMEKFLNDNGRKLIGWDEILAGGLAANATVMSWQGVDGGIAAAKSGHDAVMSPQKPLYFDHGQTDNNPAEPKHWPGRETIEKVYAYDPIPQALNAEEAKHILGAQANLWTVFTNTDELLDIQTYPRQCALAEITWTPKSRLNWDNFKQRLENHYARLSALGINYWKNETKVRTYAPELPLPAIRSTTPVTQNRDHATYDWATRHQQVLDFLKTTKPEVLMIGDSITHYWAGQPAAPITRAADMWKQAFGDRVVANLGFGWDRTENVLWRIDHGELDGINPKQVVLMIGVNNLNEDSAEDVVTGIDAICRRIHSKLPETKILVLGILPQVKKSKTDPDKVNFLLQTFLHPRAYIDVVDFGNKFRNADGSVNGTLFSDGTHPNPAGYKVLSEGLQPLIAK